MFSSLLSPGSGWSSAHLELHRHKRIYGSEGFAVQMEIRKSVVCLSVLVPIGGRQGILNVACSSLWAWKPLKHVQFCPRLFWDLSSFCLRCHATVLPPDLWGQTHGFVVSLAIFAWFCFWGLLLFFFIFLFIFSFWKVTGMLKEVIILAFRFFLWF